MRVVVIVVVVIVVVVIVTWESEANSSSSVTDLQTGTELGNWQPHKILHNNSQYFSSGKQKIFLGS